jgi:teichuronic acid biosynthesis glycosyltransferase TuaC
LRVLTFTSLFPNSAQPNLGIFIYQRMAAFAALPGNSLEVIAPLPYAPGWLPHEKSRRLASIPRSEAIGRLTVHHPRYALLPKVSMLFHGRLMAAGSMGLAKRLHQIAPFEVVDAHFVYPDGAAALAIGRALGIPTIVSARGSDINLFPQFRSIRPHIRETLRGAAGRIAVSQALKSAMQEISGSPEEIRVIGNGVDPSRFFRATREEARRELDLPRDDTVIVAVAALLPLKGQDKLIRAVKALLPQFPKLRLYLVGEGPFRKTLESLVRDLDVADRVQLPGACPNERLRLWYSAADLSALASSREGWPNVVLESLACGTPVVATRVWGVPEILGSPDLGILVDGDLSSLTDGLRAALTRPWDAAALASYARSRDWAVVAREVECYFREVLANS